MAVIFNGKPTDNLTKAHIHSLSHTYSPPNNLTKEVFDIVDDDRPVIVNEQEEQRKLNEINKVRFQTAMSLDKRQLI
jgi:hypothetical protein